MNFKLRSSISGWRVAFFATLLLASAMPVQAGNPMRGESIYSAMCAGCHGGDGRGVLAGVPSFQAPSPALMKPDSDLALTIRQGRGIMPGFATQLQADQIADVIAHLRTFY